MYIQRRMYMYIHMYIRKQLMRRKHVPDIAISLLYRVHKIFVDGLWKKTCSHVRKIT